MTNTITPNSITNEVQTQLQEKYKGILATMQELLSELAQNLETKEDPRVLKGTEGYTSEFISSEDNSTVTHHTTDINQATWYSFENASFLLIGLPEDSYQILRYNDLIIPEVNRLLKELQGIEKVLKVLMKEPKQRGRKAKVKPAEVEEATMESTESQAPF
jgi:hypothetical protein